MVIARGENGIVAHVILADFEFLPENLNNERVVVYRRGESTDWQLKLVKALGTLATEHLLKPPAPAVCDYKENQQETPGDPMHQHADEKWWWYEETWAFENGPFDTYEEAYTALGEYCLGLERVKEAALTMAEEIKNESHNSDGDSSRPGPELVRSEDISGGDQKD